MSFSMWQKLSAAITAMTVLPPAGIRCPVAVVSLTRYSPQPRGRPAALDNLSNQGRSFDPRRSPFPCHPDESAWLPTPTVAVVDALVLLSQKGESKSRR